MLSLAGVLFLTGMQEKRLNSLNRQTHWKNEKIETKQLSVTPAVTTEIRKPLKIRVLLTDTAFQSFYHPSVTVRLQGKEVTWSKENVKKAGGTVEISEQEEGIQILSIQRQQGCPVYGGKIEIKYKKEGLTLVNELPLEEYLMSVVPGEMPASYEMEALKAQAVCARTYAYKQIQEQKLKAYGADVDDSVNCQVYGNSEIYPSSSEAVRSTEGKIITQNGEAVEAYYFSTSSGITVTDEIWGTDHAAPYLKSVPCTFDTDMPWSSWSVEIPWQLLAERAEAKMGTDSGLLDVSAEKKSQSGAVTGLRVITEQGAFSVENEYAIREFLSPAGLTITEKDGTETRGGNLLPSAFFELKIQKGVKAVISGKGYGHGVGMSQNGANGMAREGYSWEEILDYFFRDIEISNVDSLSENMFYPQK